MTRQTDNQLDWYLLRCMFSIVCSFVIQVVSQHYVSHEHMRQVLVFAWWLFWYFYTKHVTRSSSSSNRSGNIYTQISYLIGCYCGVRSCSEEFGSMHDIFSFRLLILYAAHACVRIGAPMSVYIYICMFPSHDDRQENKRENRDRGTEQPIDQSRGLDQIRPSYMMNQHEDRTSLSEQ
jgi:hypothetical protein